MSYYIYRNFKNLKYIVGYIDVSNKTMVLTTAACGCS